MTSEEYKPMSEFRNDVKCLDKVMIVIDTGADRPMIGATGQYNNKFWNIVPEDEIWSVIRQTPVEPIIKTGLLQGRRVIGYYVLKRNEIPISPHPWKFMPE